MEMFEDLKESLTERKSDSLFQETVEKLKPQINKYREERDKVLPIFIDAIERGISRDTCGYTSNPNLWSIGEADLVKIKDSMTKDVKTLTSELKIKDREFEEEILEGAMDNFLSKLRQAQEDRRGCMQLLSKDFLKIVSNNNLKDAYIQQISVALDELYSKNSIEKEVAKYYVKDLLSYYFTREEPCLSKYFQLDEGPHFGESTELDISKIQKAILSTKKVIL